jgi:hypothetical protein
MSMVKRCLSWMVVAGGVVAGAGAGACAPTSEAPSTSPPPTEQADCATSEVTGWPATITNYEPVDFTLFPEVEGDVAIVVDGFLPAGLSLDGRRVTGRPRDAGAYTLLLQATFSGADCAAASTSVEVTTEIVDVPCDADAFVSRCDGALLESCEFDVRTITDCAAIELRDDADNPLGAMTCGETRGASACVTASDVCGLPYRVSGGGSGTGEGLFVTYAPCPGNDVCLVGGDVIGRCVATPDHDTVCALLGPTGSAGNPVCIDGALLVRVDALTTDPCGSGLEPVVVDCVALGATCDNVGADGPRCVLADGATCPASHPFLRCSDGSCGLDGRVCGDDG